MLCYRNCWGSVAVALWKYRRWHYQVANLLTEEGLADGGIVIMGIEIILVLVFKFKIEIEKLNKICGVLIKKYSKESLTYHPYPRYHLSLKLDSFTSSNELKFEQLQHLSHQTSFCKNTKITTKFVTFLILHEMQHNQFFRSIAKNA